MNWKKFSYTKKGLIIGLIIGFIINLICLGGMFFLSWDPSGATSVSKGYLSDILLNFFWYPAALIFVLAVYLTLIIPESLWWLIFFCAIAISTGIYGAIGVFIGWLIGKIKSSKQK